MELSETKYFVEYTRKHILKATPKRVSTKSKAQLWKRFLTYLQSTCEVAHKNGHPQSLSDNLNLHSSGQMHKLDSDIRPDIRADIRLDIRPDILPDIRLDICPVTRPAIQLDIRQDIRPDSSG